jgi:hypothetical protein
MNARCNNLASDKSFGLYDIKQRQLEGIKLWTENGKRQAPLSPPSTKLLSVASV